MERFRTDKLDKWVAKVERPLERVAETATLNVFDVAQTHPLAETALMPGTVRGADRFVVR